MQLSLWPVSRIPGGHEWIFIDETIPMPIVVLGACLEGQFDAVCPFLNSGGMDGGVIRHECGDTGQRPAAAPAFVLFKCENKAMA